MKSLITLVVLLFSVQLLADNEANGIHSKICSAFAQEHSGEKEEWSYDEDQDTLVYYQYDDVYNYCIDNVDAEKKNDGNVEYYEFALFVCGGSYQDEALAYTPETGELESLYGGSSGDECPYAPEN